MSKKILKRSLALGALMAFVITGSAMAAELTINPNTIQRAYRELEMGGYIQTVPGKGCFVCGVAETPDWSNLDKAVSQLLSQGVSREEILKRIGGK